MQTSNYIVDRIEQILKDKKYSRYKLAKTSGISQSSVTNLLNRRNVPSIISLERICDGLGMTLAQFFSYNDEFPNLSEEQKILLTKWYALTDNEKARVDAFIQGIMVSRQ